MRSIAFATIAAVGFATFSAPALACSKSDAERARAELAAYFEQNPDKAERAREELRKIISEHGGTLPESRVCSTISQLLSRVDSER